MRIKAIDRVLLLLTVLLMIALGVFLAGVAWHFIGEDFLHDWVFSLCNVWENTLILTLLAAVLLIIAVRLLYGATTPYKRPVKALVKRMESGTVSISLDTIAEIARRNTAAIEGIRDVRCAVVLVEEGVRILYKIAVDDDAVIPEKTQAIQNEIKERVESLTGVSVQESNILVENPKPKPVEKKKSNAGELL